MNDTHTTGTADHRSPLVGWTRRDKVSLWVAACMAAVAVTAGVMSTGYNEPVTADTTHPTVVVGCDRFAHGTPSERVTPGVCYLDTTDSRGYPWLDTADYGTDIPRCASDDWNASHLPRCYTTAGGTVILLNSDDTTLATIG